MKSIIRWPGLVAFFVVVGLFTAISILFLDFWIKLAAEKTLGLANRAEVNIESVEHTFSPFSITLNRVQLTDPSAPDTNQLETQTVSAAIDLPPLLLRKLIIDDLKITGVEFGTLRDSPGDVYEKAEDETVDSEQLFVETQGIPSVDEILAKSPLKTTLAIEDVEVAYEKHSDKLQTQYEALPSKEKLENYQKRIKELTEADYKDATKLLAAKEEFDQLKDEIKADKKQLEEFKTSVDAAKADLGPKVSALKAAPTQDYEQLKSLLAGDADAIEDVTTLVFGEQIGQWSQYTLAAFEIIGPMLKSSREAEQEAQAYQGKWINFDNDAGLPDLLIRKSEISIKWQEENISSYWTDITYQHDIIGRATTFVVDSSASKLWNSLKVDGELWLSDANGAKAQQTWALDGLTLSDLGLVDQEKISGELKSGLVSSTGSMSLAGDVLSGKGLVDLQQLLINATGSNKITNIVADTLNQLKELTLTTDIAGTLGDLDLSIGSDLNQQIGGALLANVSTEQQEKLDELKQKLNLQTSEVLGEGNDQYQQLFDWEKLADGDLSSIDSLLEAKLDSLVDQKKDEAKDKLLNKLFN
ncbi:TIGR03545 family protein [uncultured Paraglaciecola sp.]|uniref:TIGR03545 family protein n=1 Tax=uncultured Paraglaciecola sp. TaxID=1765024 RepID=UPI002596A4D9|nr:TIGR03545 family protein [uncultured Paraglaciecola sp.]